MPYTEALNLILEVHVMCSHHSNPRCPLAWLPSFFVYLVNSISFSFIAVFSTPGNLAPPGDVWHVWRHLRKQPGSSSFWTPLAWKQGGASLW